MEAKKKLRCPLGVPGGIIAALIGLGGIIMQHYLFKLADACNLRSIVSDCRSICPHYHDGACRQRPTR